ncbi:hypothetical protein TNIN_409661 [Trichonephila inaurata madagascariensis]|uniref:Uncharacterized protein n=1 Tax=Trichonephila inaurata madagascariensis TaxID=2747483 RepID=A0A8X6JB77_9ARAC|nr:hypothetical protein TNIN_409661 [Trichonephila inaurata madagascariensis]
MESEKKPYFTKRLKKKLFRQVTMRMREKWPALEAFMTSGKKGKFPKPETGWTSNDRWRHHLSPPAQFRHGLD